MSRTNYVLLSLRSRPTPPPVVLWLVVGLLVCWGVPEASGQATGDLEGQVFDNEGFALPGVTVTLRSQDGSFERIQVTNAEGRFGFDGLEVRSYTIMAELEAFNTVDPVPIFIRSDQPNTLEIQMFPGLQSEEDILVQSLVGSADFQGPLQEQSGVAPGGLVTAFTETNLPVESAQVDRIPIGSELGGFSAGFQKGDESVPCLPIVVSAGQSSCVASSDLTPGQWKFVGNWLGNPTNEFNIDVDFARPGVFTLRGNGQGGAIATKLDNSLATFVNPLIARDPAIVWTTGFGPNVFDDRPEAFDKRGIYNEVDFSLGGIRIPDENFIYIGQSGCCVGVDQFMFFVPEGVPHGCAVPLTGGVFIEDRFRAISPVSLAVGFRFNGDTCSDTHGFSAAEITRMDRPSGITRGVLNIKSSSNVGEGFRSEFMEFSYTVNRFTNQTYDPLPAAGTCSSEWFPPDPSGAFFPERRPIAGTVTLTLPGVGREFRLNEQSDPLPHFQFFFSDFPELDPGQYQLDFEDDFAVDGVDFTDTWNFNLSRSGAAAKEALIDRVPANDASFANIVNAWSQGGINDPDLYLLYEADYPGGPRGDHKIECVLADDFDEADAESVMAQEESLRRTQLRQGIPLQVFTEVTIVPADRDLRSHDGAPLDFTEQREEDIVQWSGFQTNP